ncbi:hypothetical protein J437_LFUL005469 [Ladona fulva]|uniref:Ig-like domain-containing protein n=1 Tax=Ladona fulva TaxID=123851 RepID=A0A8K0JZH7_LADFU|nr:hypothetical protein J437_LFUL005469 [Ladona fulva]
MRPEVVSCEEQESSTPPTPSVTEVLSSPSHSPSPIAYPKDSAVAVHITALRVPAVVRNGSSTGALLDCEYALGAREQRRLASETGLVVKWFLVGSGPAPVYQWIPGQRPQDFGALRGRVDLAFKVTGSDERGAHRALRIPTPTTDLSGEYKCSVSTFEDEDFMVKRMLVFGEYIHRVPFPLPE